MAIRADGLAGGVHLLNDGVQHGIRVKIIHGAVAAGEVDAVEGIGVGLLELDAGLDQRHGLGVVAEFLAVLGVEVALHGALVDRDLATLW